VAPRLLDRLGLRGVGDVAQIEDRRVRVVGLFHGLGSLAGAYVVCSVAITITPALLSGLSALRALQRLEPPTLLR
jgi:hypothetical protein